jgi:hypothetical protein
MQYFLIPVLLSTREEKYQLCRLQGATYQERTLNSTVAIFYTKLSPVISILMQLFKHNVDCLYEGKLEIEEILEVLFFLSLLHMT